MQILAQVIGADAQVISGACYFIGAQYTTTGCAADKAMIVYNENSASKTAAKKICTLCNSDEVQSDHLMLPLPGIKCEGIYVDWDTAGVGIIYYSLG